MSGPRPSGVRCSRPPASSWTRSVSDSSRPHAPDRRDGRPHRPREDVARPCADRKGHGQAPRGTGARHLDRPRLRAARPSRRLSLVDVPGHERFVRNMVAGATGIDLFLLVLDATEGARPQTHEHLAILRLLGIAQGVVAVTKADAADPDTLELAVEEGRELVPDAAVVPVSAVTGQGLDDLRAALAAAADRVEARTADAPTRLFVDRVFTLRGIGTVATGTLWSGSVGAGDSLAIEPGAGVARVRSVQVHDTAVERAAAGQRVAVALPGVGRRALRRGNALVKPGAYVPSFRLDVVLEEVGPIEDGARLHVHHGTGETVGRVVRAGGGFAQLRLAAPV